MNDLAKNSIAPEIIAAHLANAAHLTDPALARLIQANPRLVELLWFLQSTSTQPGSLEKFARDTIEQFSAQFGPAILRPDQPKLTHPQRLELWLALDQVVYAHHLISSEGWWDDERSKYPRRFDSGARKNEFSPAEQQRMRSALAQLTPAQFHAPFIKAAMDKLAERLRDICHNPGKYLPGGDRWDNLSDSTPAEDLWWADDLLQILFAALDAHAARALATVAQTEVALITFEALDYAWAGKVLVQIEGSSRFGKTTAVRAWCMAHPGKARLVSTPGTNLDRDLYQTLAEALGHPFTIGRKCSGPQLKEKIEAIIRPSSLMFVFDEGHFLLPQRITAVTLPARLNWCRTAIIDRKLPVAIVTTPQTYAHALNRFVRATGYNFEQWLGRIAHTATLPESLSNQDLLAIARFYGPDLTPLQQKFVVAKAEQKESYIKAVENIISLARWIATRARRDKISLADLELAAAGQMRPQPLPTPPPPAIEPPAPRPIAPRRGPPAPALEPLTAPTRSITPATQPLTTA